MGVGTKNPDVAERELKSAGIWQPPRGWVPAAPGAWQPANYHPSRWELPIVGVYNRKEAQDEYIKCAKSTSYFALRWVWTLDVDDPTGEGVRKFPAYPFLRRFFSAVHEPSNTHVEKTRQMMLSWAWMVVFLHDLIFRENFPMLILSKRAKDVDDGGAESTPDSNMGKIRFMHDRLPEFLWTPFEYKTYSIACPATRSYVKGETGKGGFAARGPAYGRALVDEAAYVDRSEQVFSGVAQACKEGLGLNSTPNGKQGVFYRIRFSPTAPFQKLSFHWSEHPRKAIGLYCICGWKAQPGSGLASPRDQYLAHATTCPRLALDPPQSPKMLSPWYVKECAKSPPDKVASELDISYSGSRRGRVYTRFDAARNTFSITHRIGPRGVLEDPESYRERYLRAVLRPDLQTFTTWDIGVGDECAVLLGQIVDDEIPHVRIIDEINESDQGYDYYANYVNGLWLPILRDVGNPYDMEHYGGQDVHNRDSKLESWFLNLRRVGIYIQTEFTGSMLDWIDYINDQQLKRGNLEVSSWCAHLLDAFGEYHYPLGKDGDPVPGKVLPVHDEWSHCMDALRYLYRVRYRARLGNRDVDQGVRSERVLRSGRMIDKMSETRKF